MTKKLYDLVVVGAGPAGLLAAKAAAENGLEVAVLERKKDPAKLMRACGQTLVAMNEYIYGNISTYNPREKRICFSSAGFSFKYDGPIQNNYNLTMVTPSGHYVNFGDYQAQKAKGADGRVGLSFDKEALFVSLLAECRAAHVDIFSGIVVDKVTPQADRVIVEGSGQKFEGSYVIGADGANSRVAALMGFNKDRYYFCNFIGLSTYVANVDTDPDRIFKFYAYLKDGPPHFYMIPRPTPGTFNVLTITNDPRMDLRNASRWFREESILSKWFKKAKVTQELAASAACYTPIREPYKDRVLLAGDSGATQELEIAGAMISGWKAGQAISTAVRENKVDCHVNGANEYVKWWHDAYINYYNYEHYMKGMTLPYILKTPEELEAVYGLIDITLAPCWNPYTGAKAMMAGMNKALATLKVTRPDLLEKMKRKDMPAKELLAEMTAVSKPPAESD
jgi:flavin-dependent dehydrogenase